MRTTIPGLIAALAALGMSVGPSALTAQGPADIAQGATVWASNCTRCHNARPSQERTDAEWATIMLHMRARANLTRSDADLVTSFLAFTNLPEAALAPAPVEAAVEPAAAEPAAAEATGAAREREATPRPDMLAVILYLRKITIP